MKKISLFGLLFIATTALSQEHFTGLTTSNRGGLLSAAMNPAEFANATKKIEVNLYGLSINATNNKIGFEDIISGKNLETILFSPGEAVNARLDAEVYGPSVGLKIGKWGFGVSTKANGKLNVVDVDANLGEALVNGATQNIPLKFENNQRVVGTTWGEVGLSLARTILDSENNKFSIGATMKLMFPGSYSNIGLSSFDAEIKKNLVTNDYFIHTNKPANLNISYSGNLANSFTDFSDYSKSIFGGFNGFVGDIGVSYQRKDKSILDVVKSKNKYKLSIGASIKNIGSMTFKDDNNYNTNYQLDIPLANAINVKEFENVDSLSDVESILNGNNSQNKDYLINSQNKSEFVVKLPTTLVAYADLKIISKLYISGYIQQKLTDDTNNDQITAQNYITVTPRINLGFFEAYVPLSESEISGFNAGFGFRLGGFYLGSGSAITALIDQKNSKQGDIYTGFRWGFL